LLEDETLQAAETTPATHELEDRFYLLNKLLELDVGGDTDDHLLKSRALSGGGFGHARDLRFEL